MMKKLAALTLFFSLLSVPVGATPNGETFPQQCFPVGPKSPLRLDGGTF